ncbi:hypothetical protein DS66_04025 [Mesotoga sp. SC_3PWM13N19]|nr:hypothetical protein DS66_04025 [Mesotoga sp. SC_3PWM13N19]
MEIANKFDKLRAMLKDIIGDIIEHNSTNISDCSIQFRKINSTINELKKHNIAVPDELIELKLSLSSKIDIVKDAERIRKELIKCLELSITQLKEAAPEKPIRKRRAKKATKQERVSLVDLMDTGIIPKNVEFYAYYKNNRISATLLADGSLEMIEKGRKKTFKNHRAAAIAITGYQVDPWKFWKLDFEGKPLTLDDYRKQYFKTKQQVEGVDPPNND